MKVMGLDSSMRNTGYVVLRMDPADLMTPHPTPHPTHPLTHLVSGGTITYDDTSDPRLERIINNVTDVHNLVSEHKPDLVVIEGALDKGINRSPTGVALYALIMAPWHPCRGTYLGLVPNDHYYVPPAVVTISPERHMAMAHQKRKLTGTEKVKKYKDMAAETPKGRVSEHQADAYFLAYHGVRFWLTLKAVWPHTILNPNETAIFHDLTVRHPTTNRRLASKSMRNEEGITWWTQAAPPPPNPEEVIAGDPDASADEPTI